jgi:hypothetical protein
MPKKRLILTLLAVAAGILCFTPYYSFALLGLLGYFSIRQPFKASFFDSYFCRLVVNFLILSAIIMIIGLYTWMLHIPFSIVYAVLAFSAYYYLTCVRKHEQTDRPLIVYSRHDLLSTCLSLVAIIIVVVTFYLPKPSTAATVQRLTSGYDNLAHYSLIQTNYEANGYVYGKLADVQSRTISTLNNYPQGWHFSNAMILKGFGVKLFTPNHLLLSINTYMAVLFLWYFLAVYVFTRSSLAILDSLTRVKRRSLGFLTAFSSASLVIQLLVFWGSLNLGFGSFMPSLVYLTLLAWFIHHFKQQPGHTVHVVFLMLLLTTAIAESWLLPIPAAALMVGLSLASFVTKQNLRWLVMHKKTTGLYGLGALLILLPCLIQAYIYKAFATYDSSALLNNDGGIFNISNTLVVIILLFTIGLIFFSRNIKDYVRDSFVINVMPIFLLSGAVFALQIFTTGKTSYYFIKMLGLALCMLGIYAVPLFASVMSSLRFKQNQSLLSATAALGLVIGLIVATGQTTIEINNFMQRHSTLTYDTANAITQYIGDQRIFKQKMVVMRDMTFAEDNLGTYLAVRAVHRYPYAICESDINYIANTTFNYRVGLLLKCLKKEPVTVIASDKTYPILAKLKQPNLTIIKTQ